jgi:hypothetical protein
MVTARWEASKVAALATVPPGEPYTSATLLQRLLALLQHSGRENSLHPQVWLAIVSRHLHPEAYGFG